MGEQKYLSKQKAARRLDSSTRRIDRLRAKGQLDWIKVGTSVRIEIASLEAYEQRQSGNRPHEQQTKLERLPIRRSISSAPRRPPRLLQNRRQSGHRAGQPQRLGLRRTGLPRDDRKLHRRPPRRRFDRQSIPRGSVFVANGQFPNRMLSRR